MIDDYVPPIPPQDCPARVLAERALASSAVLVHCHFRYLIKQLQEEFPDVWEQTWLSEGLSEYEDEDGSWAEGLSMAVSTIKAWADFLEVRIPEGRPNK